MDKQHLKETSKIQMNSRYVAVLSNESTTNEQRPFQYDQQQPPRDTLKITVSNQRYQPEKQTGNRTNQNQHQSAKQESGMSSMEGFGSYIVSYFSVIAQSKNRTNQDNRNNLPPSQVNHMLAHLYANKYRINYLEFF